MLQWAALEGDVGIVALLCFLGVTDEQPDNAFHGESALHLAAFRGHDDVVRDYRLGCAV